MRIGDEVKVKCGAIVGQDFSWFRWPHEKRDLIFTITQECNTGEKNKKYGLRRHGYGLQGDDESYGNGAIFVYEDNLVNAHEHLKIVEIAADRYELERLRVQLAGCSAAALGYMTDDMIVKEGQYGWSPAYQDVIDLRRKYINLLHQFNHIKQDINNENWPRIINKETGQ